MSRRYKDKGRIPGQYTAIRWEILDSAAWKQMSMGARSLYIALIKPLSFNRDNNGSIFLSTRDAAQQLNANKDSICLWYRELEHYGFIVMTRPGTIGPKGMAAHWRITDVGWGKLDGKSIEPTKDYLKWDGEVFSSSKTLSPTKPDRVSDQTGHRAVRPNRTLGAPSVRPNRTYTEPSIPGSNRTYLDQPYPPSGTRSALPHSAVASVPDGRADPAKPKLTQEEYAAWKAKHVPRPPRTPEEQAKIDAQVERTRRELGIPQRSNGSRRG
jgi:hypothetical protein